MLRLGDDVKGPTDAIGGTSPVRVGRRSEGAKEARKERKGNKGDPMLLNAVDEV